MYPDSDKARERPKRSFRMNRMQLILILLFILSLGLVWQGWSGNRIFERSGFDHEAAYPAIYSLGNKTKESWKIFQHALNSLPSESRDEVVLAASGQLKDLSADKQRDDGESVFRSLYADFLCGKSRIGSRIKKEISAMSEEELQSLRSALLRCISDPEEPLPDLLADSADTTDRSITLDVLFQALFQTTLVDDESTAEQIAQLKKSVRSRDALDSVKRMIANGEIRWADQLILSRSRTIMLAGIVLAFNAVILSALMLRERTWKFDLKWLLIVVITDFLLIFQLFPLLYLLHKAFFPEGQFTLAVFRRLYTYPLNLDALSNTLIASFATMVLGTLIAFPLAWLVGRTNLYGKKFFRALFVMTYMVPPYVGAMAWLRLLNPNVGTLNVIIRQLFRLGDRPGPLNIYSLPGMIWVLTSFYFPYAFITISRAMEKMDPSLEEASRISGASPIKTLLTVTIPMMSPSLAAGALLVFVSAASCYGIPSIIGGPGRISTVTTRITEYVALGQQGLNDAVGLSVFLVFIALLLLLLSDFLLSKRQYITVSGKSVHPVIVDLRKGRLPATIIVSLFSLIVVFVPFLTVLSTSLKSNVGESLFAEGNLTAANWTTVFSRSETLSCLKNSFLYASAAASAGIVISCVMSYLLQRTRVRGRRIPDFLITLGSGTPSVVIALSLIMTMKGNFGIDIYNTAYIIIIAYLIKYLMMGMRTVVSAVSQIHISLEESSQISGAGWRQTMFHITVPLIFPSIAAGWFLIFIPCFYELSMTTLLYSSTTKTIGFQLFEYWSFTSQPMSCAMAFGILLMVALLNLVLNKLTKGEFSI